MKSQNKGKGDGCVVPFHCYSSSALTAGAFQTPLNPTTLNSARLAAEADAWAHFRIKSLKVRLHHGALTGDAAVGLVGGYQDTPPSTIAQVMELIPSAYQGSTYTKPSEWAVASGKELAGPFPWYKTIPGSADATEEQPGSLVVAGTGTDVFVIELRGVFEFKTSVAPSNTPAALKLRQELRLQRIREEREAARTRLLSVVAATPVPPK